MVWGEPKEPEKLNPLPRWGDPLPPPPGDPEGDPDWRWGEPVRTTDSWAPPADPAGTPYAARPVCWLEIGHEAEGCIGCNGDGSCNRSFEGKMWFKLVCKNSVHSGAVEEHSWGTGDCDGLHIKFSSREYAWIGPCGKTFTGDFGPDNCNGEFSFHWESSIPIMNCPGESGKEWLFPGNYILGEWLAGKDTYLLYHGYSTEGPAELPSTWDNDEPKFDYFTPLSWGKKPSVPGSEPLGSPGGMDYIRWAGFKPTKIVPAGSLPVGGMAALCMETKVD